MLDRYIPRRGQAEYFPEANPGSARPSVQQGRSTNTRLWWSRCSRPPRVTAPALEAVNPQLGFANVMVAMSKTPVTTNTNTQYLWELTVDLLKPSLPPATPTE